MSRILLCWLVFHLTFSFELYYQFLNKSKNHSLADEEILNLYNFSEQTRPLETLNAMLKEGEAVRISARYFTKTSPLLSWHACFEAMGPNPNESDNTYSCVALCSNVKNKTIDYVGIKNRQCYCLNNLRENEYHKCPDTQYDSMETVLQGKELSKINILQFVEKGQSFEVLRKEKILLECIAARRKTNKLMPITYEPYPCNITIQNVKYICKYDIFERNNVACKQMSGTNMSICVWEGPFSWLGAIMNCRRDKGKLANLLSDSMKSKMVPGQLYWTGMFRYFSIINSSAKTNDFVDTFCLSAIKQKDSWLFEQDVCSFAKPVDNMTRDNDRFPTNPSKTGTETYKDLNGGVTPVTIISTATDEKHTPDILVTSIVSVLTILFIILMSVVAIVRCRKSKNVVYARKRRNVTEQDNTNSIKKNASGKLRAKKVTSLKSKSLGSDFRISLRNYDIIQADIKPSPEASSVTTGESVYDSTSCRLQGKMITDELQPNIYSLTNAVGGLLKSESVDSVYIDARPKATGTVAVRGDYDKIEMTKPNEDENVYSKTKVGRNNEVAIVDLDLYSHINTPSAENI